MKRVACLAILLAFAGCKGNEVNLSEYVAQAVQLKVPKAQADGMKIAGTLNFTHTRYFTNYRTECETYACGEEAYESCTNEEHCSGGGTSCTPVERCSGGGTSCTPVERCTSSGCTTDTVCHTSPGSCTTDSVCHTDPGTCYSTPVCHTEYRTRYCERNCRQVPYADSSTTNVPSAVTITVKGLGDKKLKIEDVILGVKTTDAFRSVVKNPGSVPKELEGVFRNLKVEHKTVLAVKAKGLQIAADQGEILNLPADFKAGQPISIELKLVPTGVKKEALSAVGSEKDIPELHSSEHE